MQNIYWYCKTLAKTADGLRCQANFGHQYQRLLALAERPFNHIQIDFGFPRAGDAIEQPRGKTVLRIDGGNRRGLLGVEAQRRLGAVVAQHTGATGVRRGIIVPPISQLWLAQLLVNQAFLPQGIKGAVATAFGLQGAFFQRTVAQRLNDLPLLGRAFELLRRAQATAVSQLPHGLRGGLGAVPLA